jgi:hypothetical protein
MFPDLVILAKDAVSCQEVCRRNRVRIGTVARLFSGRFAEQPAGPEVGWRRCGIGAGEGRFLAWARE